jgi:hypothetical protein
LPSLTKKILKAALRSGFFIALPGDLIEGNVHGKLNEGGNCHEGAKALSSLLLVSLRLGSLVAGTQDSILVA